MRKIFGLLTLFIALLFLYFLQNSSTLGGSPLPPLGSLLNPYTGIWQNTESLEDYEDLNLSSPFIQDGIEIVFDDRMFPHIYADNLQDPLFAPGFV